MDGRAAFVVNAAVQLIAAGGAYGKSTLAEVTAVVMDELHELNLFFAAVDSDEPEPGETLQ